MVKIDKDLRVSFAYMIQQVAKDGKLPLTVVRGRQEPKIELPVSAEHPTLVTDLRGDYPSYFVYGPMVFSPRHVAVGVVPREQCQFDANAGLGEEPVGHSRAR